MLQKLKSQWKEPARLIRRTAGPIGVRHKAFIAAKIAAREE